jgi:hypothetical protein
VPCRQPLTGSKGGEAEVILFSMATSTGADMIRGADFLFSRNRLNVEISRARCLAYLCVPNTGLTPCPPVPNLKTQNAFRDFAPRPSMGFGSAIPRRSQPPAPPGTQPLSSVA